jgi:hypothetical protein
MHRDSQEMSTVSCFWTTTTKKAMHAASSFFTTRQKKPLTYLSAWLESPKELQVTSHFLPGPSPRNQSQARLLRDDNPMAFFHDLAVEKCSAKKKKRTEKKTVHKSLIFSTADGSISVDHYFGRVGRRHLCEHCGR